MEKSRWLAGLLMSVAALGVSAGTTRPLAQDEPVTITFWNGFTASDRTAVEAIVGQFNESQDEIQVDMTIMPWDVLYQRLLPAYSAGEGPTVVAMDAIQLPGYISRGVLAPIDDYYESDEYDADELSEASVTPAMWEGQHYGVPMGFTPTMLYWNKQMFADAGIEAPPKTWEEWIDAALKLTDVSGSGEDRVYGLAIPDHAHIPQWAMLLWGNGGGVVSQDGSEAIFGDPASIEAVEMWSDLIIEDNISPVGLSGSGGSSLFGSSRAAMIINGPWASGGYDEAGLDYGIAPVPAGPDGAYSVSIAIEMSVDASVSEEEKRAAYEFMSFWNSAESQIQWSNATAYPPHRLDVPLEAIENPTAKAFAAGRDSARFYLGGVVNYVEINDNIVVPTIQRITNNRGEPADLMPAADDEIQALLDSQ